MIILHVISQAIKSKRNRFKEHGKILTGNQLVDTKTGEAEDIYFLTKGTEELDK